MSVRFLVGDVFDRLAELEDGSVDLVVTSPPFLALRSYLPADHPDKHQEIGSEATPAEFIDVLLRWSAECRRVLAPHGSMAVEIGDTYAGSGGGGGDYLEGGWREGQQQFAGSSASMRESNAAHWRQKNQTKDAWPLAKSKTLIPELLEVALAYGINPLTGTESPAGRWRVRNVVTWARPNPPVGALGDKWRPATSDVIVVCTSAKRYWDDLATRKPFEEIKDQRYRTTNGPKQGADPTEVLAANYSERVPGNSHGAPLLDYWEIPPGGYKGSHYAVFPPELVVPLVKAMCPQRVCVECGEPSRRIVETANAVGKAVGRRSWMNGTEGIGAGHSGEIDVQANDASIPDYAERVTTGWTDCGHDNWRPGLVLDPFAGSGTTLMVAHGHGHDAIGIDLDQRNAELARERVGPFFLDVEIS